MPEACRVASSASPPGREDPMNIRSAQRNGGHQAAARDLVGDVIEIRNKKRKGSHADKQSPFPFYLQLAAMCRF